MSDTAAAIRAAQEMQAEVLAPDLYRQAKEVYFKARREYKFKNFAEAETLAKKARKLAEQAEFESFRAGATRGESQTSDPYNDLPQRPKDSASSSNPGDAPPPQEYDYPVPGPTPAEPFRPQPEPSGAPQVPVPQVPTPPPTR